MGRKSITPAEPAPVNSTSSVELMPKEGAANRERDLLVTEFGDSLPWHREHYEAEIRGEMRRGCEAFLRAGSLLLVARAHAEHGEWAGMLDRLGLEQRQAHRMMTAAQRVADRPDAKRLIEAVKSTSKLIELLSLPEDQFAELAEEGQTGGLDLEGLSSMTRKELRAAVADLKADIDAKDERSTQRERKIEKLEKDLRAARNQGKRASPDETAAELRAAVSAAALDVRSALAAHGDDVQSLLVRLAALQEHAVEHDQDHGEFMGGVVGELFGELRRVRDMFTLPIINDSPR